MRPAARSYMIPPPAQSERDRTSGCGGVCTGFENEFRTLYEGSLHSIMDRVKYDASSITRKLHAYARTWQAGIHRSRFDISHLRVRTVTSSETRCENIRIATSAVSGGQGMFLQIHITSGFFPTTCLGSIWRNTADQLVSVLD